jgi:hypothetical protein
MPMRRAVPVVALLAGILLAGCSNDSPSPTAAAPQDLTVSPADGATGVRLDAAVTITFASQVDQDVVERDLHLISEHAMTDSTCPESTTMDHGAMADWMTDSTLMHHMDLYHSTHGRFSWNGSGTACTFQPDSTMTPVTQYMIHMGHEMMDMVEHGTGGGGMMPGHGTGMMSGDVMLHFATMDTAAGHAAQY